MHAYQLEGNRIKLGKTAFQIKQIYTICFIRLIRLSKFSSCLCFRSHGAIVLSLRIRYNAAAPFRFALQQEDAH